MSEIMDLIDRICSRRGWQYNAIQENLVAVEVPLEGKLAGRSQMVFAKIDGEWLRYWAVAGPLESMPLASVDAEQFFRLLLQYNADLPTGAYALIDESLVVLDTQLIAVADRDEIAASLLSVATFADLAEDTFLGGEDAQ
ncbi:MAG: hypothetical protein RL885_09350 [Planctomycetota bacterium]